jgi:hypothetical protein
VKIRIVMETKDKIQLVQKQLPSGNHQVKFFIHDEKKPEYGYLLIQEPKPVGEILDEICQRLEKRRNSFMGTNPYSLTSNAPTDHDFYLFSA